MNRAITNYNTNVSSTNFKQRLLRNHGSVYIDTWLLWKITIYGNGAQYVNDKIIKAPVSEVFDLSNILQFIIDCFYYGQFPQEQFVRNTHQSSFHVALEFGDELYHIHKQPLDEFLANISFVANQFPIQKINKGLYLNGSLSSISLGVIMKLSNSPFSLKIKCSLNPKNQPMEHFPSVQRLKMFYGYVSFGCDRRESECCLQN